MPGLLSILAFCLIRNNRFPLLRLMGVVWLLVKSFMKVMMTKIFVNGMRSFFYTSKPKYGDPETTITLDVPYLCKYWDENAESTGKSGANIPVYRYADVLLMCAEAKATLDGGSTSDAIAVDAYFQVRHRALPNEARPTSITVDQVLKERAWELCYEFTGWYDMLRTHRAFDPVSKQMVDLFGYQAVNHTYPFKESDLVFPVPLREKELNPLLGEDVVR